MEIKELGLKLGRPKETAIKEYVLTFFDEASYGTIKKIQEKTSEKYGRKISWNTIRKYLEELVLEEKIAKIVVKEKSKINPDKTRQRIIYHIIGLQIK